MTAAVAEQKPQAQAPAEEPGPYIIRAAERVVLSQTNMLHMVQAQKPGLKPEHLERPATFGAIAQYLRPMDHIYVTDSGLTFWAHCLVVDADRGRATVKVLQCVDLPAASREWEARVPEGFRIYRSTLAGEHWVVERKRDGKKIRTGLKSGGEALEELMRMPIFQN